MLIYCEAASSKSPGGLTTSQSGKQEGLSNTDTKHSTDIANDPEKSKKGEGSPETAKLKGTVSPARPQVGFPSTLGLCLCHKAHIVAGRKP